MSKRLTHASARQMRSLYFAKGKHGALEYGIREVNDPTAQDGWRLSHDAREFHSGSELYTPADVRDAIGKMELVEGLCLDLYVYLPTSSFDRRREDWELWENICVRFNGTDWELAEYPVRF